MYYLAKFCRICMRTNVELIDVESHDEDYIKLSQKLEECTTIVISKESLSTKICTLCVKKLKVSYDFHKMCKKSSKLLQGILSELISDSDKITNEIFTNSELTVTLLPLKLPEEVIQDRVIKSNGTSILKSLLSCKNISRRKTLDIVKSNDLQRGGLRNIITFTRNFDFGYSESKESSISKLVQFSEGFFKRDFSAFQRTVLYIIENSNYLDEEDEMLDTVPEEIKEIPFEEVVIEPDIKVKTEMFEDYEDNENFKSPCNEKEEKVQIKNENVEMVDHDSLNNIVCDNEFPFIEDLGYLNQLDCHRKFSQNSIRCRTRGNPYINPHLKKQFMLRSFQCKECPRYFKTPGYLKAHRAKVHNALY
ncbi:uncharacterized protein LOC123678286 [Harmonia axyridis]|uniref:uncharacterized protein LOC123678286 n=1 Tax=Harmonia axyridis TaxID=115357 RepID=UPI001E278B4B|nr:uncharacterized protein LOC123678286 [Harmonia axyridis]XP_045471218.1 uncharacterized protein LOC123678286 [Harmonia axyridis]